MLQLWRKSSAAKTSVRSLQDRFQGESEVQQCARILASSKDLCQGRQVHWRILQGKHSRNVYLGNLLITMYGRCGSAEEAHRVFQHLSQRNQYSYNLMIQALAQNGRLDEARQIFDSFADLRTDVSWRVMLSAYAADGSLQEAKNLFDQTPTLDVVLWTILLQALADQGEVDQAADLFGRMPRWDTLSWSSMIVAFAQAELLDPAREMLLLHLADSSTAAGTALVMAYGKKGLADEAKEIFDAIPVKDEIAWKVFLTALSQNGLVLEAAKLFQLMPLNDPSSSGLVIIAHARAGRIDEAKKLADSTPHCNLEAWTVMITAFGQKGSLEEAKAVFDSVDHRDLLLWTAFIDACGVCSSVGMARDAFDRMPERDLVASTSILSAYAGNGFPDEGFSLFLCLPKRCVFSWSVMISGYVHFRNSDSARKIFYRKPKHGVLSCTAMIAALAHSGSVESAKELFESMPCRDKSCWATLATLCSDYDHPTWAYDLLCKMPQWENPNSMIIAYAQTGMVDESKRVFDSLVADSKDCISWTTLIDAYASNGECGKALESFSQMILEGVQADQVTYISVLQACSYGGLVEKSFEQFRFMIGDDGVEPVIEHYHCVVDVLCRGGRLQEAEELVIAMPLLPDCVPWTILLGGCRTHGDLERGSRVARQVFDLDPQAAAHYSLLFNILV